MMKTVNISLPIQQFELLEEHIKSGLFASMSEAVRTAIRETFMKARLTENGFTPESEQSLMERAQNNAVVSFKKDTPLEDQLQSMMD